jgi:methylglutaconyl-CoA hydratase
MGYRTLEIDLAAGVATVWLNRPDVRNAMRRAMCAASSRG